MARSSPSKKRILIASDHAGFALKESLRSKLDAFDWIDVGPRSDARCDYPDFARELCERLNQGEAALGLLICGSGIGMSIAANKMAGIRAAVVSNPVAARLAREHNNANVLCLGSRFLALEYASEITLEWLNATFSNDVRHRARVQKMTALEINKPMPRRRK